VKILQRIKLEEIRTLTPEWNPLKGQSIELSIKSNDIAEVDKDPDFVSINRMLKEKELKPLILHAPFYDLNLASRDEKIRNYALKNMLLSLDFCMETDIPTLVFHTGINPLIPTSKQQGTYELLKLSVREIIKDATKKNISLLVENTYEKVFFYFKKLFEDFPDLKMTLDIGHCHCFSDYSTDQWIAEFKSQIIHYHIHDNDCSEDAHLSLGKGKLPFSTIFPLLDREKTITLETPLAETEINQIYLEKLLQKGK
jgi:sugar phosphate isomerase/epimerase